MLQTEIIFTGDELLFGEVLNTHAQYLGQELSALGIESLLHTTVGDNFKMLKTVLLNSIKRSDLILITGGLGPTTDDLTKETVADLLNLDLIIDEQIFHALGYGCGQRGLTMTDSIKKQALVPHGALVLPNPVGTAPGILIQKNGKIIILLPGPPRELKAVFEGSVKKYLESFADRGLVMSSRVLKLTGISESQVQDKLDGIEGRGNPTISYVAMPGEVHVRITARATSKKKAQEIVDDLYIRVKQALENYIFSTDDEVLKEIVGALMIEQGKTISLAESCTGGQIMKILSDVPGSSRYLVGGVVAYSNEVKINLLGVPREIIDRYGAVSEQTARLMATGIRKITGSSLGIGITGIAGPGGGTLEKPLGLLFIALADKEKTICRVYHFSGQRAGVRSGATNASLKMLRLFLLQN